MVVSTTSYIELSRHYLLHCCEPGEANEVKDDAEHILMNCETFKYDRQKLIFIRTEGCDNKNFGVPGVLEAVVEFAERVLSAKELFERELQQHNVADQQKWNRKHR